MNLDDPVCLCFHVTRRKVVNFIRVEKPRRPSQLSECFGAGTGCGWCRPFLERILADEREKQAAALAGNTESKSNAIEAMTSQEYAQLRSDYVREGGGTPPPGATPIEKLP